MQSFDAYALGSILFEIKTKEFMPRVDKDKEGHEKVFRDLCRAKDQLSNLIAGLIAPPS